jgi:hypothetical protein
MAFDIVCADIRFSSTEADVKAVIEIVRLCNETLEAGLTGHSRARPLPWFPTRSKL